MDYFFDNQIRRYLLQFMRIFSDMKIRNGPDTNGLYTIQQVPIMYGDPSWVVAQIIKGASENTLLPTPMFSAWIEEVRTDPKRIQDTQYVGKVSTMEREFDPLTQSYNSTPGVRQDVERYMPVPIELRFRLDAWTSNITTKLQIFEQIRMIFNPSIQLQQNSNILDWTSIFEVWLEDHIWTNRSIPQGGNDDRDVLSFKFKVPAWINPPAKLKRSGLIAEIVTNVFNVTDIDNIESKIDNNYNPFANSNNRQIQIVTTEGNFKISVGKGLSGDEIILLNEFGQIDTNLSWQTLIQSYGQITPNITKIRLKQDPDLDSDSYDIIGNISQDSVHKNILFFTPDIDTLPGNTLSPILAIIDPTEMFPGNGLPIAAPGQRYLLTSRENSREEPIVPMSVLTSPWGPSIVAYPNDIIEYNGDMWSVIFNSRQSTGKNYVINNSNSTQYVFDSTSKEWGYSYYGQYSPGMWRIDNIIQSIPNNINIYE